MKLLTLLRYYIVARESKQGAPRRPFGVLQRLPTTTASDYNLAQLEPVRAPSAAPADVRETVRHAEEEMDKRKTSMIGVYGEWAASLAPDPPELSFRRESFSAEDIDSWRAKADAKTRELIAVDPDVDGPRAVVRDSYEHDGLLIDEIDWALPSGPPTAAIFLRPSGSHGKLPGILGLHDHSGLKYFGWEKIAAGKRPIHPILLEHRAAHYGGRSWANELAKRGFAVLVHDVFPFASRRIREAEVNPEIRQTVDGKEPGSIEEIIEYNRWAAAHESIVAKSLFSAGTTWPALYLHEDLAALSYLISREEVDGESVGCCGLSGGGMRTAYLAGLDRRVKAAVCVGFMTTWRDFVLDKAFTHSWMVYAPLLPRYLDFPEIAALRVPQPFFVQNNREDQLFSLPEMERAASILQEVYEKAGVPEQVRIGFYPGPHKFDIEMQEEAFAWLSAHLGHGAS